MKQTIFSILAFALLFVVFSCANIGRPDGGPYDELPPKFVKSSPAPSALNNSKKKISIEFDEFIKLENASEKVVVSPPQIQMPDIKKREKKLSMSIYCIASNLI